MSVDASWAGVAVSDDGGTIYGASDGAGIYKSLAAPSNFDVPTYLPTFAPSSIISPTIQPTDASSSNTWVGPQLGTSGIGWLCITSDAIGVNLAAGSTAGTAIIFVNMYFILIF